jgi:hypothetical protein
MTQSTMVEKLKKFHEDGKGIAVWADNQPYYVQANAFLKEIAGFELEGSTPGHKVLKVGSADRSGEFDKHLLTTGLVSFHEGSTICFPTKIPQELKTLAMSTDDHPCVVRWLNVSFD